MQRRERTRHLIELGGLLQKAGLVELASDDRATLRPGLATVRPGGTGRRLVRETRGRGSSEVPG